MKNELSASAVLAAMLAVAGPAYAVADNPFGLVYATQSGKTYREKSRFIL